MPGQPPLNMGANQGQFPPHGNASGNPSNSGPHQQGGPSTPGRLGPLAPSVVISPSAPVCAHQCVCCQLQLQTNIHSTFHHPAQLRRCLTILHLPRLARRACCSIDYRLHQKTQFQKALGRPNANIRHDSISQIKGNASWKSFQVSMKYLQIADKSCSCRNWINVTSYSTSTMHQAT